MGVTSLREAPDLCTTPECINAASQLITNMAPNWKQIDPCENFYEYACGGFVDNTLIPAGDPNAGHFITEPERSITAWMRNFLEGSFPTGDDAGWLLSKHEIGTEEADADYENFELLVQTYDTCMNTSAMETLGFEPLQHFISLIVDTFPASPDSNSTSEQSTKRTEGDDDSQNLGPIELLFAQYNLPSFYAAFVDARKDNVSIPVLSVVPDNDGSIQSLHRFLLYPEIAQDEEALEEYATVMASTLAAVHPANLTEEAALSLAQGVIELELGLAEAGAGSAADEASEPSEADVKGTSYEEFVNKTPSILGIDHMIEGLMPVGSTVDKVYPSSDSFFYEDLPAVLSNTSDATVQAFYIWKAVVALRTTVMAEKELGPLNQFMELRAAPAITTVLGQKPRSEFCIDFVNDGSSLPWFSKNANHLLPYTLGGIMGRFYVDQNYHPEDRELLRNMTEGIVDTFVERLPDRGWLSEDAKKIVEEKIADFSIKLGFPEEDPDTTNPLDLKAFYSDVAITAETGHLDNALLLSHNVVNRSFSDLVAGQWAEEKWTFGAPVWVNAYYTPMKNEMVVPAGITDTTNFNRKRPLELNFGSIGMILAHELLHGYDSNNFGRDADGSPETRYDNATLGAFAEVNKCLAEYLSEFSITGPNGTELHVRGEEVLGEAIPDVGGISISYDTWKKMSKGKDHHKLPGFEDWTADQLLFLSFGQNFCEVSSNETAAAEIQEPTNAYAPWFVRVEGSAYNSKPFLEAFNCPTKEPKCTIW